jgi:hypothetical protein
MSDPIILTFRGQDYTIPPNKIIRLGVELEDMMTFGGRNAWQRLADPATFNLNLLALAYHHALTYAGAKVELQDVRQAIIHGSGGDVLGDIFGFIRGLEAIMIPPAPLEFADAGKANPDAQAD